jgi:hypothetical protein
MLAPPIVRPAFLTESTGGRLVSMALGAWAIDYRGCASAQATAASGVLIAVPSSRTRTGTK